MTKDEINKKHFPITAKLKQVLKEIANTNDQEYIENLKDDFIAFLEDACK